MKRMTLDDDEVALVMKHREEKRAREYDEQLAEKRKNCAHNYVFDFHNYKTSYYKCDKCGQGKAV